MHRHEQAWQESVPCPWAALAWRRPEHDSASSKVMTAHLSPTHHEHDVNSSCLLAFRAVLRSVCRVMKIASINPGLMYGSLCCLHRGCTSLLAALRLCRGRRGKMWCSIWNCSPP